MQQRRIEREPGRPMLDIASDVGGRQTRQFIQRLFRAQREKDPAPA
jgi:vanillate O-demethylase monooxygenase subunit